MPDTLPKSKSRNLVVSIDGTSNQFGPNNTNVVELHSRIIKDSEDPSRIQLTFYLSGIGTYVPPSIHSVASWKQWAANKIDLAIAWNFKQQVQDAYRWLADHYQPGDLIFLFGFSRGAYQVRALAGMINKMGLVYSGNQRLIPFAYELYVNQHKGKTIRDREEAGALCSHFKKTFSRDVRVHFIGVWDTVSSVGVFRGPPLPLTTSADHVCHFRHALALDERRVRFLPDYVRNTKLSGTIKEVWFAGTHSDIGGGNRKNITLDLAGIPLLWMENEATSAGLYLQSRTDVWKWEELKRDKPIESLKGLFWWFLEKIPLSRPTYKADKLEETISWPPHNGRGRVIVWGQLVHASVAFKDKTYMPCASLSDMFYKGWDSLVGQGTVHDIQWAQSWETRLEMDLFDPSVAGEIGRQFVAAVGEHRWPFLKRIPFLALSGNAVSSLVDAGIIPKLISILNQPDVDQEMQAISSTCLRLLGRSSASALSQLTQSTADISGTLTSLLATSNSKQQLEHLTLLAASSPPNHSDIWETVSRVLLDIVSNPETNDNDLHRAAACLATFVHSDGFRQVSDKRYIDALLKLLKTSILHTLESIGALSADSTFDDIIKGIVPEIPNFSANNNEEVRHTSVVTVRKISERPVFHQSIQHLVPQVHQVLEDHNDNVRSAAATAVGKLSEHTVFHNSIKACVPQIIDLLKDTKWSVRQAAKIALGKLVRHVVFHDSVKDCLPQIIGWFGDTEWPVRWAAVTTVCELADHIIFHDSIKDCVPRINELLKDPDQDVRSAAATTLAKLSQSTLFHDSITKDCLAQVINWLEDTDWSIRRAAVATVGNLSDHVIFHDSIKNYGPQVIGLLKDTEPVVQQAAAHTVGVLSHHVLFQNTIQNCVPQIIELLVHYSRDVRFAAATTVGVLAGHAVFCESITGHVPQVIRLLEDNDWKVRLASLNAISQFADQVVLLPAIDGIKPQITKSLQYHDKDVRLAAKMLLDKLASLDAAQELELKDAPHEGAEPGVQDATRNGVETRDLIM